MNENEILAYVGKLSRQMQQFAEHVGTESAEYRGLKHLAELSGLELVQKGNYQIPSRSMSSTETLKNMTTEKQSELVKSLENRLTWGKQKEYYEQRLKTTGKLPKSRKEQETAISEEIKRDEFLNHELNYFVTEVYRFLRNYSPQGVYLDTLPSEPYVQYSETIVEKIVDKEISDMTLDEIKNYVERVRAEMRSGGQTAGVKQSVVSELWSIPPETP